VHRGNPGVPLRGGGGEVPAAPRAGGRPRLRALRQAARGVGPQVRLPCDAAPSPSFPSFLTCCSCVISAGVTCTATATRATPCACTAWAASGRPRWWPGRTTARPSGTSWRCMPRQTGARCWPRRRMTRASQCGGVVKLCSQKVPSPSRHFCCQKKKKRQNQIPTNSCITTQSYQFVTMTAVIYFLVVLVSLAAAVSALTCPTGSYQTAAGATCATCSAHCSQFDAAVQCPSTGTFGTFDGATGAGAGCVLCDRCDHLMFSSLHFRPRSPTLPRPFPCVQRLLSDSPGQQRVRGVRQVVRQLRPGGACVSIVFGRRTLH